MLFSGGGVRGRCFRLLSLQKGYFYFNTLSVNLRGQGALFSGGGQGALFSGGGGSGGAVFRGGGG